MLLLEEDGQAYFTFINSLKSDATRKYTISRQENPWNLQTFKDQIIALPQWDIKHIVIKYCVNLDKPYAIESLYYAR